MWPFKEKPIPEKPKRLKDLEDDIEVMLKKTNQIAIGMEALSTRVQKLEGRFYQHMGKEEPEEQKKPAKEEDLYKGFNEKFF